MTHLLLPRIRIPKVHFMICLACFGLFTSHINIDNTPISFSYFSKANFDDISIIENNGHRDVGDNVKATIK